MFRLVSSASISSASTSLCNRAIRSTGTAASSTSVVADNSTPHSPQRVASSRLSRPQYLHRFIPVSVPDALPFCQFPVRAEGQPQVLAGRGGPDRLPDADGGAAAVETRADTKGHAGVVLDKPFSHGR